MADFLHGIEHVNLPSDSTPVNDIVTAVIGLVGTADGGTANELVLCKSAKDDAHFGTKGTIPEALKYIRMQDSARGGALVFVVKVKSDTESVTAADIIGAIDEAGERTGLKLFETAMSQYGFEPMIYIVPRYSALSAVKQELIAITTKNESIAYIDTPDGYTFNEAITSRGASGEFSTLNEGQKLLFPHFLVPDPDYNPDAEQPGEKYLNIPMSAFCAGLRAKIDVEEGWHVSSSNHNIIGPEGMDVPLTFGLSDRNCETNLLNAAGITTAVNMFGHGIVEWGNYTAGFPGNSSPEAFECVRRTRAIMKRSIDQACIQFIDKYSVSQAHIDAICNTVNQYYNGLVSQGKILEGKCYFRKGSNPTNDLAMGYVTFDNEFTPAIPMQKQTYRYKIDLSGLINIK